MHILPLKSSAQSAQAVKVVKTIRLTSVFALSASVALVGCSTGLVPTAAVNTISVTGNWQVASNAPAAARLPVLTGELTGAGNNITGIVHASAAATCVSPTTAFELTGAADAKNNVKLTGANFAGGTLTLTGTLAADGKSISGASYNVVGGSCAFTQAVAATAQSFANISGTYNGSFSDPDGNVITISSSLTQTPASDTDGNFQLSGTATLPNNPCFNSPVAVSNSQVTGGTFTLTYADQTTGNSVTATGTFSPDGSTLTVNPWSLTGSCGPDSGTGLLTKQ
jgi:hypothetical protein